MVTKFIDRLVSKKKKSDEVNDSNNNAVKGIKEIEKPSLYGEDDYQMEIVWRNVFLFIYIHISALYGLMLKKETWAGVFLAWSYGLMCAFGTTIGAHRLYTHRAFRANKKLQILLLFWQTMAVQNSMYEWVRDHRVHHKYTDTNADPHNAKRGFFFSHMGWLMCKKHPDVKKFGAKIDMSDLENDPYVMFQHKYYFPLALLVGFIGPVIFGLLCGETLNVVWHGHILRYIVGLHLVWCINSVAHYWGTKPYDKYITSTDSYLVGTFGLGEGWHNYHHVFPFDYKCAELPTYWCNLSLMLIDFFASIGWATDLKTVSSATVMRRIERTGDGSKEVYFKKNKNSKNVEIYTDSLNNDIWGYDDTDMTTDYKSCIDISHKKFD